MTNTMLIIVRLSPRVPNISPNILIFPRMFIIIIIIIIINLD